MGTKFLGRPGSLPGNVVEHLAGVVSKASGPVSPPAPVALNRVADAGGDSTSLQTIPKSLQSAHPNPGEKDPLAVWQAKPAEPGYETSAMDEGFVDDIFTEELTPEELSVLEEIVGQKPSPGAKKVDEADSGAESDSECDPDATTTGPTPAESGDGMEAAGGTDDPEDPSPAGVNDANEVSSPVQATPGQKLTSKVNLDALQHLFRGRADAAELVKLVLDTPSIAAKKNILDFAILLRVAEEKASNDISLSQAEKDEALAELDGLAKDYTALVKADGLGKKSAFGVYYTGHYRDSKKIQKLAMSLGEASGSRTAEGGQALRAQMLELYIDSSLRDLIEQKYGGNVDATAEQLRDLVNFPAKMALQRVSEACQKIAEKNDKLISGAVTMLMLLTTTLDLVRGDEDENAAKAAKAKAGPKKAPLTDPNSLPPPASGPGTNPASNPASNPTPTSDATPAATTHNGNVYNGPVYIIENSFNNENSITGPAEGGGVPDGEVVEGNLIDLSDEGDVSSSSGNASGNGSESIDHGFKEIVTGQEIETSNEPQTVPVPLPRSGVRYDESNTALERAASEVSQAAPAALSFSPFALNLREPAVGASGFGMGPPIGLVTINREPVEVKSAVQALAIEPVPAEAQTKLERFAARLKAAREQNPPSSMLPKVGKHIRSYLGDPDPVELTMHRRDDGQRTGKKWAPSWAIAASNPDAMAENKRDEAI